MSKVSNALTERWPKLASSWSPVSLGTWPTDIEPLKNTGGIHGGNIWIKREDLSSSHLGGNKVRKLEFLLGGPPRSLITFGASGSHHVLATAIHGARCGHRCVGILVPQMMSAHHRRVRDLLDRHCAVVVDAHRPISSLKQLSSSLVAWGSKLPSIAVSVIPPGASSPVGTLGYVCAGLEIAQQVKEGVCPPPRRIYVALGTGGTSAGLALGLALAGLDSEVVAVRVASQLTGNRHFLSALAGRTMKLLQGAGLNQPMPRLHLNVENGFIGSGYAHPTPEGLDAVELGRENGLALETTYTGKAFAAMLAAQRREDPMVPVMFIHTAPSIDHLTELGTCSQE